MHHPGEPKEVIKKEVDVPSVQRDVIPDPLGSVGGYAPLHEELPRRARAFNFDAMRAAGMIGETEIVQHSRKKYHLAVDFRAFLLREDFGEPIATHDMVEEHVARIRPRELLGLTGDLAVRNLYICDHDYVM
jgi:hypothetical protein